MRISSLPRTLVCACLGLAALASAQAQVPLSAQGLGKEQAESLAKEGEKVEFQSDIARLMRVVVSHLYHERDVFLRELVSNSGDALEKLRVLSLTDPTVLTGASDLNITLAPVADESGAGRLVIRDTGIGMTKEELVNNLGTIARSGTSEFLAKVENSTTTGNQGSNLIGQFGLGFYSSFLVSDRVVVASKSPYSSEQYVFESEAESNSFRIAADPRGNTLGRGTEITLYLRPDAQEYLKPEKVESLISRNSEFATTSPIYVWTEETVEVPVEKEKVDGEDEVEEEAEETRTEVVGKWKHVNSLPPLWMRDPKEVEDAEYNAFFKGMFKAQDDAATWSHFRGDAGTTSFRAIIYIPSKFPSDFFSKSYQAMNSLKLYVRRVFITSDLGDNWLPKWMNWLKIVVDADDLPLNVGRDSLQKNRSLRQIQKNLVKKAIDLFNQLASEPEKYDPLYPKFAPALKLATIEDKKNQDKLVRLLRFETSALEGETLTGLEDYIKRRKVGQNHIFFLAGVGQSKKELEKSPFVEKLIARGYEVLYFTDPMDEMLVTQLRTFSGMGFQDVAKKGLKYGDEDQEEEKAIEERFSVQYAPLTKWIENLLTEHVKEVVISTRLTTSPCAVVVDNYAWTGNMERLMAAQNGGKDPSDFMAMLMKTQKKTFEINPSHPLIEALLEKVEDLTEGSAEEEDMIETVQVLWDTSSVRSGFPVKEPDEFFHRIESILRRSLGVSQSAEAKGLEDIKPAPPVDDSPREAMKLPKGLFDDEIPDDDDEEEGAEKPDVEWTEWADIKKNKNKAKTVKVPPVKDQVEDIEIDIGSMMGTEAPAEEVRMEIHDEL